MSDNNVVSIGTHPKFRSVATLRDYLEGGAMESFGTKPDMDRFFDSKDPEVLRMLSDLNSWCEDIKGLEVDMDKWLVPNMRKKGDYYAFAAMPHPADAPTPLHHMSRNRDRFTIALTTNYKVKGEDDASPTA